MQAISGVVSRVLILHPLQQQRKGRHNVGLFHISTLQYKLAGGWADARQEETQHKEWE
jgi:hypothetical protein